MLENPTQNGSPKKQKKNTPGGTKNHPKMTKNRRFLRPKTPTGTKKAVFCNRCFFVFFLVLFFRHLWSILGAFWVPRSKRWWSVFRNFFVIFWFLVRF